MHAIPRERSTEQTALAELQPRLEELRRIAQVGGWYYDRVRQVSWWSPEMYRLFGMVPTALGPSYEQFLEFVHPEDRERVRASYDHAIEAKIELRHEFRIVRRDGVTLWLEAISAPQRDGSGVVIRYEGTNQDITLRKARELEVYQHSTQLHNAFDLLSEGMQVVDYNYRYLYLNDSAQRHCGASRESLVGVAIVAEDAWNDDDLGHAMLRRCMQQREAARMECVTDFCGRLRGAFNISIQPVPEGLLIVSSAATVRQLADQQLRDKDNELAAYFDSSNAGMCECGFDGKISRVNDTVCRLLGYSREELLATSTLEIVAPDERESAKKQLQRLERGELKNYQVMRRYVRGDGTQLPVMVYVHVNRREREKPVSFVVVITDMTAQVKLEEQVRQSEKMHAIGRLAGGIAHDFNNLLTVIVGTSKLISSDPSVDAETREHAEAILEAGVRGAALTQQLLTYSRRQAPQHRALHVNAAIRNAELLLRRIVGDRVQIQFELDDRASHVLACPTQFEQVLLNLIVNARDAMPDGGTIYIATSKHDDHAWPELNDFRLRSGPAIEVAVKDTGTGIDPSVLRQIYDPFFTTKPVGQGTGLGLSVVQGIIEQSRGHIEVETRVGSGTTMHLFFPEHSVDSSTPAC